MGKTSLASTYRTAMRRHRFGYALYEPAPFTRLRPGMLGYLDTEYQRWHRILDLTDASAVEAAECSPMGAALQRSEPDKRRYGPLTADRVTETSVELEAGLGGAAVGVPVLAEVGGVFRYSTARGFGAVLLCGDEVVSEGFDFRDPFHAWLQRNAKVLFSKYPDAKKHGLCAATWTYSSTNVGIATLDNSESSVTVGFDSAIDGIAYAWSQVKLGRKRS